MYINQIASSIIVLLIVGISSTNSQANVKTIIRTIAGQGVCDGPNALAASLSGPSQTAMNSQGDLFIADRSHHRIRKVFTNGTIITIAGTGFQGFNGDGIDATTAQLNNPNGIAVDSKGLVYISDSTNNRIRKILSNGTIVTIVGTGTSGFSGDGGLAINANIYLPYGIAISPINDDLIIADVNNNRIRKISSSTGIITTIAGTSSQGYNSDNIQATSAYLFLPYSCGFTSSGKVIISDSNNNRIRLVGLNGIITTIAGTGSGGYNGDGILATSAKISSPFGVVSNSNDEIYFADSYNNRIRKILSNGTIITVAGTGTSTYNGDNQPATSASLATPFDILVRQNGEMFISETGRHTIRRVSTNGTISTIAGTSSSTFCIGIAATNTPLGGPKGIYFDKNGNIIVVESSGNRISKITKNGYISSIAGTGNPGNNGGGLLPTNTQLSNPYTVTTDLEGQLIVSDTSNNVLRKILNNGTMVIIAGIGTSGYNGDGILATKAKLSSPSGIVVTKNNEIIVADTSNFRIRKILTNGTIITIAGIGVYGYLGDNGNALSAKISSVYNIALDPKTDELFLFDGGNYRIRKILLNGTIITVAGSGAYGYYGDNGNALSAKLGSSGGLSVDMNGEIYIADQNNNRIRKVLTNGTIITFAGNGLVGFYGENIDPTSASLNNPNYVSVSQQTGEVLISDTGNNLLRMVSTLRQCNGTLASDPLVCSGHGICYFSDICTCNPGYAGQWCEIVTCDALNFTDPLVCNSHGICSGPDLCNCTAGYSGTFCNLAICNGINSGNLTVCNGHGTCQQPDICNCTLGYSGQYCEIITCNGLNETDPLVCNGNGDCLGPDICNCTSEYVGTFCETLLTSINNETLSNNTFNNESLSWNESNSTNSSLASNETVTNSTLSSNETVNNGSVNANGTLQNNVTNSNTSNANETIFSNTTVSNSTIISNTSTARNDSLFNNNTERNETIYCFGLLSNDSQACHSRGQCIGMDQCKCLGGYYGNACQYFNCYGIASNDSLVCGGHGKCVESNKCECKQNSLEGYWKGASCNTCNTSFTGPNCNEPICTNQGTCNSHGECDINTLKCVCSGNWEGENCNKCKTNFFGTNCQVFCDRTQTCSGNGECSLNGTCLCYSNEDEGFFGSSNCNSCQSGYYGEACLTRFIGPLRLSDEENGVEFTLMSPSNYQSLSVPCSQLIHYSDLMLLGEHPNCYWKQKETGLFMIELGNNYQLELQDNIRFNTSVFDLSGNTKSQYLSFTVESPVNSFVPISIISTRKNMYSLCEDVTIDGSSSYSLDRKPLVYIWSVLQIPNLATLSNSSLLSNTYPNSTIQIPFIQSDREGTYIIRLQVESSFTKIRSDPIDFSFSKFSNAIPTLTIEEAEDGTIDIDTLNVPVIIEKKVSLPSCYSNSDIPITIEWIQTSGGTIDYSVNSNNDLVIVSFPKKGSLSYTFILKASIQGSQVTVSNQFTIQTDSENLFANLFIDTLSSKKATLLIETQDVEESDEDELWSYICVDENLVNCGQVVSDILSNYASLQSKSLELSVSNFPSVESTYSITLTINKGARSVSSELNLKFPKENQKLPPIISLLNVVPNRNRLSTSEVLNLQVSITNSDGSDVDNVKRDWKLNGQPIDGSYLTRMSSQLSDSNNIILNLVYLTEGSSNQLTCQVTDLESQQSSTFTYSFHIITSPSPCPCTVSPSSGYALETDFTFSCANCQNKDNTLAFTLSFVDDKSGALIPLVIEGGNTFTTKLPYPASNPLMFDITIVDTETGASVQNYEHINIALPYAKTVAEVKKKVTKWNTLQNSLQQNDLRRMIFSSAIISRTAEAMVSALNSNRRSTCLNGGVYNSQLGKCNCVNGYKKKDCSIGEEFEILQEFKRELFNNFMFAFENRQEQMSEMYIIYQLYGLDSLLSNYDELSYDMFENGVIFLKRLISSASSISSLQLRVGVDKLAQNIVNSLYNYLIYNECTENDCLREHVFEFTNMLKEISQLLLRSKFVGEADLKLETDFFVLMTNKNYRYHFSKMKVLNLTLPMNDEGLSAVNGRMLLSFISTSSKSLANDFNSTREVSYKMENDRKETHIITKDYSISTHVKSFSFLKEVQLNQSISYSFSRNEMVSSRIEQTFEYSCVSIWNNTEIRNENNCRVTISPDTITCNCPYQSETKIAILRTTITTSVSVDQSYNWNNLFYLFFLFFLVLIVVLIVIAIIVGVLIVKRRRNSGPVQTVPVSV